MPTTKLETPLARKPSRSSLLAQWLKWKSTPAPTTRSRTWIDWIALAVVVMASVALAVFTFGQFADSARLLWGSLVHDRNAHYLLGLSLAQDILHGDIGQLLTDLDGARTWPPLHGILVAVVLLIGGVQFQLAVLPSLAGWAGTIVFGFLTARRLAPRYGNLAGFVAAIFILSSPAHRAYATDIMLESLGACLSLAALYLYTVAVQDRRLWAWCGLGMSLTALFFLKYNYWSLVVFAILASTIAARPRAVFVGIREWITPVDWRGIVRKESRNSLNYVVAALAVLLGAVLVGGGGTFEIAGRGVSIQSPHNILHLIYVIVFIRVVAWWIRTRKERVSRLQNGSPHTPCAEQLGTRSVPATFQPEFRCILLWHVLPVALWFLWPKRLGYWLWYLFANGGENPKHDFGASATFYAESAVNDYHFGVVSVFLAATLMAVALATYRRLRPGAFAVILFVMISAAATIPHPNQKSRFLHSWIAAGWVLAGVGFANLIPRRMNPRWGNLAPALGTSAVALFAIAQAPAFVSAGDSPERGHNDYLPASTRDITDYYLAAIGDAKRVAMFSTMEIKHLLRWSYMEAGGKRKNLIVDWKSLGTPSDDSGLDALVFIDVPPETYLHEITGQDPALALQFRDWLVKQSTFYLTDQRHFSLYGCTVSIYRRHRLIVPDNGQLTTDYFSSGHG